MPTNRSDQRWWVPGIDDDTRAQRLWWRADRIRQADQFRRDQDMRRTRDYGNVPLMGFGNTAVQKQTVSGKKKVGYNVTKALCDTFMAKITKEDPKVSFVTDGGDWELQQRARANERFVQGQFYEMGFLDQARQAVLNGGGIWGTGIVKFFIEGLGDTEEDSRDARIRCEQTIPYELLVDEQEGIKGRPRNLMQSMWVDRLVLAEAFPEHAERILEAPDHQDPNTGVRSTQSYEGVADQVLVIEAWHLRSGPRAKDGRHALAIEGLLLEMSDWDHDWYPFVFYRKQDAPLGFWGIGLAAEVEGIQTGLNVKEMRFDTALRMVGAAHVLVHSSSRVNFAQWDNEQGSKIEYTGVKPEIMVPPEVVPEQLVQKIETDYHRAFELTGIPEAQAQGGTPTNLESGKAQEVYLDATDQRMNVWIKRYHAMFLDAAKIVLAFSREIAAKNPKFGAKSKDERGSMQKLLFSEIELAEDEYILQMWPTNLLSDDPAARMGQVTKLMDSGVIDPDRGSRLLDFPDMRHDQDLAQASYNAVERCIAMMLDEGRFLAPIPNLNLTQAVAQVNMAIVKGWLDGRPDDRLNLLRQWLEMAKALPGGPGQPQTPQTMASAGGTPVAAAPAAGTTPMMQGQAQQAPQSPEAPPPGASMQ